MACAEVDKGKRFDEATLKQLTGSDPIRARKMRQDFYQFEPTHKFAIIANYKPIIKGNDTGIWRRILRLPWTRVVDEARRDRDLPNKLRKEAPGIFNRILAGCMAWQQDGLHPPSAVQTATEGYRKDMDPLLEFFEDRCVFAPLAIVPQTLLHAAYSAWLEVRNERPVSYRFFNRQIKERGITKHLKRVEGKPCRVWVGIGLHAIPKEEPSQAASGGVDLSTLGDFREMN